MDRAGWLRRPGRCPRGPGDPLAMVPGQPRRVHLRPVEDAMSISPTATPIRPVEEATEPRPLSLLRFDPWLMLGAIGLIVCSLITLNGATKHTVPGHPLYYVERQAIYA